jgi:hypothetical protein
MAVRDQLLHRPAAVAVLRLSTSSSMPCETVNFELNASGGALCSRSKSGVPAHRPLGRAAFTSFRSFCGLPAAFSSARLFSMTCAGAWAIT